MSSDFTGSVGDDSARLVYDSRLSSQRFDSERFKSFSNYAENETMEEGGFGEIEDLPPPSEVISEGDGFAANGPILPPAAEMEAVQAEEGFALREWRRQNAIRLEEKDRREKEMLNEIIEEAEEYKAEYYRKWKIRCENSRSANREKEKLSTEIREKFHTEADKNYWKAIAELVPKEIPAVEKKGKKDKEKKPSIVVIQGPKPGKPTDLLRMRQILVKLKHKPPGHMLSPPQEPGEDAKTKETASPSAASASASVSGKLQTTPENQAASAVVK